jgi:hypothetical protein
MLPPRALPLAPPASPAFPFTVELRSVNETATKIHHLQESTRAET